MATAVAPNDTVTKELYLSKGKAWDEYKSILAQYSDEESIAPEDKIKLDRLESQFKAIREQVERRANEKEMADFFNQVDTEKRLPVMDNKGDLRELEISHEIKAYNAMLRGGALQKLQRHVPEVWRPFLDGKTALGRVTDANGGYLTPDIYVREFINKRYLSSFVRQAPVSTFRMTSDLMHIPTMGTASTAAILTAEANAFSEVEPTFAQVDYTAYKFTKIVLASEELVADAEFDLFNEVVLPDIAQAFALAENTAFTTSDGSSKPQGIITGATTTTLGTGNATSFAATDVITQYHKLPLQYRNSPSVGWMANDSTIAYLRKMVDNSGGSGYGNFLWQPGLQAGEPDRLLGKPVYPNNSMDAIAASKNVLLIADFQYFRIGDRLLLAINTLTERYAELGQVAFRAQSRFDSHVLIAEAIQVMKTSAT